MSRAESFPPFDASGGNDGFVSIGRAADATT